MFMLLAVALLTSGAPDDRVAAIAASAPFHLYVMPASASVQQATVLAEDPQGRPTDVRIVYRMSGNTLTVEEAARTDDGGAVPSPDPTMLVLNGFPAQYVRTGTYFRHEGHLTMWAQGVTVKLSSTDLWDVPALVNAALSLH